MSEKTTERGARALFLAAGLALLSMAPGAATANTAQVARGRYLVSVIGCGDCHTPGALLGRPDWSRFLGGSQVGFALPGLGVFFPPNLTPDPKTGLGRWTKRQIVTALTTGKTPSGRELAPIMPYRDFAHMTPRDAMAVAAYLKTLKPVHLKVPGPFGPKQTVSRGFVMTTVPAAVYNRMPKKH